MKNVLGVQTASAILKQEIPFSAVPELPFLSNGGMCVGVLIDKDTPPPPVRGEKRAQISHGSLCGFHCSSVYDSLYGSLCSSVGYVIAYVDCKAILYCM